MTISTAGHFRQPLAAFLRDEMGATAIEYALIGSMLSVVIVASAILLGDTLQDLWSFIETRITGAVEQLRR